jgi:hypothetical protein
MHALDLALFVKSYPDSTMARLVGTGYNYTSASTPKPSDSLPGNLALCTGGSPFATGVFYDRSYDRSLWPPNAVAGPTGTPVLYDESVDLNPTVLDGGGGLNPLALPRDPARDGALVYPHNYLRVNTTFEVVKAAGYRTAWIDKHLSDEIVHGPSGQGVDDLWTPEIAANFPYTQSGTLGINKAVESTMWYDNIKVQGVLNQINGTDHTGSNVVGVPALFGMNFQALSVAQKLAKNNRTNDAGNAPAPFRIGGYYDGSGTPSMNVSNALWNTDLGLSNIVRALQSNNLFDSTYIVLTSKHGQGPIDTNKPLIINPITISNLVAAAGAPVAHQTADTSALLWLADPSKTALAVATLLVSNNQVSAGIQDIWSGEKLKLLYGDPATDPRVPDIIAVGRPGVIYRTGTSTFAEHGGYSDQEVNVPIVISNPHLAPQTIRQPVTPHADRADDFAVAQPQSFRFAGGADRADVRAAGLRCRASRAPFHRARAGLQRRFHRATHEWTGAVSSRGSPATELCGAGFERFDELDFDHDQHAVSGRHHQRDRPAGQQLQQPLLPCRQHSLKQMRRLKDQPPRACWS